MITEIAYFYVLHAMEKIYNQFIRIFPSTVQNKCLITKNVQLFGKAPESVSFIQCLKMGSFRYKTSSKVVPKQGDL